MSTITSIEWTHVTDNIIVVKGGGWFCIKCSIACNDCYAEKRNLNSFWGGNLTPYTAGAHPNGPPELILRRDLMAGWAKQKKPKLHFVASMTDIFGEWVPREWVFEFLDAMHVAHRQTFQLLTKRAQKMAEDFNAWLDARGLDQGPDNIWLGITAENQKCYDDRVIHLAQARARIRFLSCEPLLSAIQLGVPPSGGPTHWIIAGGKSGPGKDEPTNPDWFRSLRDQCEKHTIAFFFKQWGNWRPSTTEELLPASKGPRVELFFPREQCGHYCTEEHGHVDHGGQWMTKAGKKEAGRLLDGQEHNTMPTTEF